MVPAVIVSPHLDDAVLSLGRFLSGRPDVIVVTVLAGVPGGAWVEEVSGFDATCGFDSSAEAIAERRGEDLRALRSLSAVPVWLPDLDSQYLASPVDLSAFSHWLRDDLPAGCDLVCVPLGIKHPDHVAVSRLIRDSGAIHRWRDAGVTVAVYEELPGYVLWPDERQAALNEWFEDGGDLVEHFIGTGPKSQKRRAVAAYASQRKALDLVGGWDIAVVCPERVWRVEVR